MELKTVVLAGRCCVTILNNKAAVLIGAEEVFNREGKRREMRKRMRREMRMEMSLRM